MVTAEEHEPADSAPDASSLKLIAALRPEQVQAIDSAVMRAADRNWRKVAFIVGTAMGTLPERVPGIPDVFYAQRVAALVAQGRLESQGNLARMRYSEVRLPE
ncbi:DUF3658 domain-containing protein [Phytopseudomonas dryadis]|uniref:DUF3658 domain-containing protein n=1 Tax=Phytopseudomonas dryadis TaxID=2487520 RepID=A0A4Q9R4K8_9GAMM|nr:MULTISPECIES: DUF3658 domain-containing protein [Pseudomonas]TBU94413.1 hypothetical protein DNK44_08800 [Pseudomonas dryadis]TBU99555.1 hypothetical protein DNK34_24285 [Pseudomonas dryadis]TBV12652.1 hypothetical protein DNK41_24305 [Pseudomonas sp. FRB 230]